MCLQLWRSTRLVDLSVLDCRIIKICSCLLVSTFFSPFLFYFSYSISFCRILVKNNLQKLHLEKEYLSRGECVEAQKKQSTEDHHQSAPSRA
jgi:hypothetical protein